MQSLEFNSAEREEMIDITSEVEALLPTGDGICVLFVQHTTCGLTVNENADPDVQSDMLGFFRRMIPQFDPNSRTAFMLRYSMIVGSSVTVPFENGKLALGRWQGIYLCEFDGPRERQMLMKTL